MKWEWVKSAHCDCCHIVGTYGITFQNNRYAAFVLMPRLPNAGGYLNDKLVVSRSFGMLDVSAYQDIACSSIEEAKHRCERYHKLNVLR